MPKNQTISGEWISGKNKIECILPLIIFEDDNNIIAFCPALDISGYGSTEAAADESFKETLSEYFRYTVNKKTLAEDLRKLGWTIRKNLKKEPIPPTMENLLQNNEDFNRIFNTYDFQKRNTTIKIPALA
ncbi:MAG: hypothetical protein NTW82_14075 [Bacteroidia bacterium]|nr:hypothetical protein [Bacteroidia bacterium]